MLNSWRLLWATLGSRTFTDLDYADDVTLLAEILKVLLPALDVMKNLRHPLGFEINWQRTKIQSTTDPVLSLVMTLML